MFSGDVFRASETYLKKDVYSLTFLICPKNISWKYFWLFKNIIQKWSRADKVDVWALKTLKKMKRRFLRVMHSHSSVCLAGSCLHVVYLSNMAYKSFRSFGMWTIVQSLEQVYFLLRLVNFSNNKTFCITHCQNTEILSKFHIKGCVIRFLISIWPRFLQCFFSKLIKF